MRFGPKADLNLMDRVEVEEDLTSIIGRKAILESAEPYFISR